jgi:hypothetical protein
MKLSNISIGTDLLILANLKSDRFKHFDANRAIKNVKNNEITRGEPHTRTLADTKLPYVDAGGVKTYFSVEFMLMIITTDE